MKLLVTFLTGQSVPGCTGLSRAQRSFLERSVVPQERVLPRNFPWHESGEFPEDKPLALACWNNVRHLLSSFGRSFRERHRGEVVARFEPCDRVVVLAGSCGLELLRHLELPADLRGKLHVFAFGPVSLGRPEVASCLLVQGRRDRLSRVFHRRVDRVVSCGHMDYLGDGETLSFFNEFYAEAAGQ